MIVMLTESPNYRVSLNSEPLTVTEQIVRKCASKAGRVRFECDA